MHSSWIFEKFTILEKVDWIWKKVRQIWKEILNFFKSGSLSKKFIAFEKMVKYLKKVHHSKIQKEQIEWKKEHIFKK